MTDYTVKRYSKYTDAELVARLTAYARNADSSYVSGRAFSLATGISEATIINHFGSWRTFCTKAGVAPRYDRTDDRDDLFRNLDRVRSSLGRQPRAKEMKQPLSAISISRYNKLFQMPWHRICLEFIAWKSGEPVAMLVDATVDSDESTTLRVEGHSTRRGVSLSLRYEVMKRDGFRCLKCGRSPATHVGLQLHVDHITAWANGGKTVAENLRTLCSDCNLGKSNRHDG
jgi:hypothetical protein